MQPDRVTINTLETISDKTSEHNESDCPVDKFNNVRVDKEREGSIDIVALENFPTARVKVRGNSLESSERELFSQQQRSELPSINDDQYRETSAFLDLTRNELNSPKAGNAS